MTQAEMSEDLGRRIELNDVPYLRKDASVVFAMNGAQPIVGDMSAARTRFEEQGYREGSRHTIDSITAASKPGEGSLLGYYFNQEGTGFRIAGVPCEFFLMTRDTEAAVDALRRELPLPELKLGSREYPVSFW
jgi:hypothetical protein